MQTGIVNFSPAHSLEPDTTYEVIVPAGGVKDVMGNATPSDFRSTFATGKSVGMSLWCAIDAPAPVVNGEAIDLKIHATGGQDRPTVRWDYGDNSPISDAALLASQSHTYQAVGRYSIRATVSSKLGVTACTTRATVYAPPTSVRPQNSSTILLDASGTQVWSVNPDNNSVSIINAVTLTGMGEVAVGRQPRTLAQAPDGSIWAVNQADATISVMDETTHAILATVVLPRGSEPYGIVFSPRDARAYVSLASVGPTCRNRRR